MADGIEIPGTSFKLPTWALLAGGAGLALLMFLRKPSEEVTPAGVSPSGLASEEFNQRLEDYRQVLLADVRALLEENQGPVDSPGTPTGEPEKPDDPIYIGPPVSDEGAGMTTSELWKDIGGRPTWEQGLEPPKPQPLPTVDIVWDVEGPISDKETVTKMFSPIESASGSYTPPVIAPPKYLIGPPRLEEAEK